MISVIVPIYKVEKYLRRCVDTILAQTYTDFELLLVDDGSPDHCPQICDEYVLQDARVHVFHKPNGGLSDARNYGLERMKGDYVTFIDSDDYVGPDYLKILWEMIKDSHVDVSVVAHHCTRKNEISFVPSEDIRGIIPNGEILRAVCQARLIFSAWGKLFHKKLFSGGGETFSKGKQYEDNLAIPYILCNCEEVAYTTSKQYYWMKRPESIMATISEKKFLDWEEGIDKLLNYTKQKYPSDVEWVEGWVATSIFHIVIQQSIYLPQYSQYARHIKEKYGYILKNVWKLPVVDGKRKRKATLFMLSPALYSFVWKSWETIKKSKLSPRQIKQ